MSWRTGGGGGVLGLVQTKFRVCLGVRAGPTGPVIDVPTFSPQTLSKQHLRFALGYVLGRRALPLMLRSVEGLPVHLETCSSVGRLGGPNPCPNKI